ncbi:alpha/beta fold hydrolase [Lentzea sp. NPDC060358]|uniref:alpha/beta fold hydrolase n=1 Tax=Lentzea sp. NPDC060358 TaxID=3347103 RepID=UPI00364B24FE
MRTFAQTVGADLPSLAAQARAVHTGGVDLVRITARTLVIAGDQDPLAARPGVLADAIPDARLVLVAGDHGIVGSSPGFRTAVADFLRD